MHIYKQSVDLQKLLQQIKSEGSTLGFVPTMGALHEGHVALIEASKSENDYTICSIFVNPTQFNDANDLARYPRSLESDIEKLLEAGCDFLYAPSIKDVYPNDVSKTPTLDLQHAGTVMEAAKRPGHYEGVIQVVDRLLNIVTPNKIYMGQKDYQQQLIIRKLIEVHHPSVQLVMVSTKRSAEGLALSSRNALLNEDESNIALTISKTLNWVGSQLPSNQIERLLEKGMNQLEKAGLLPEYLSVADAHTLELLNQVKDQQEVVICAAAFAGKIRLIDNLLWPESSQNN